MDTTRLIPPEEARRRLYAKGFVHLELGSYHIWILKKWHEMFLRKGLVTQNKYGQFVPVSNKLYEFSIWAILYDDFMQARDGRIKLTPEQGVMINSERLFETQQQANFDSGGSSIEQPDA